MLFSSWLRALISKASKSGKMRGGRCWYKNSRSIGPFLEQLEKRICPSNTYTYPIIAQTNQAGISAIREFPSINDSGEVAFIAALAAGGEAVFAGNATTPLTNPLTNLSGPGNANTSYLASAQINNMGDVLATERDFNPNFNWLKLWDVNNPGSAQSLAGSGVAGTSIFTYATLANDANPATGDGIAFGALTSAGATPTLQMPNPPLGFGTLLSGYTGAGVGLQPMMANNNEVVFQGGNGSTFPILMNEGPGINLTIASSADFSALGGAPGISPDGQVIAFYGVLTADGANSLNSAQPSFTPLASGPGIFASIKTATHGRVIIRVAGTGGNDQGLPDVGTFDANDRVAVNSIQNIGVDHAFTVAFMGQSPGPIISDGIYVNLVNVFGIPTDPTGFRPNIDTLVAQAGDTITGVSGIIETLNIDDSINSSGQVAFWVNTDEGVNAVVVANPVPVLAVAPLNQGNPLWASSPYAGGGLIPNTNLTYTIGNNGCALTSLAMALNYAGAPSISYIGQSGFTPLTLNLLLEAQGGYAGHSINWSSATDLTSTDIAAAAGDVPNLVFNYFPSPSLDALTNPQTLTNLLMTSHEPVIVGVNIGDNGPHHFVLVTGMVGNQFTINDPDGGSTDTTLAEYDNEFQIRGYISDPMDISDLTFVAVGASPVNLLVTDPSQEQTGADFSTGTTFDGIPQSVVFTDALEDSVGSSTSAETASFVAIAQPQAGSYSVSAGGMTAEPYTIYASPIATDGTVLSPSTFSGNVTPGSVSTFTLNYNPQPPVSLSQSSVAVSSGIIASGSIATVTLTANDTLGNQLPDGGLTVSFGLGTGTGSGTFGSVKDNGDGTYTATFTGATAGSNTITATINGQAVTSAMPTVTVATAPVVTTNPTSQVASAGNSVSFVAGAVGTPAPTVQWQASTDGGKTFSNIAGATSPTLTFTTTSAQNDNEYRAAFTNSNGAATTTAATLTVSTTPSDLVVSAAATGVFPQLNLIDPATGGLGTGYMGDDFGGQVIPLATGNVVVTAVGAVYLFNGQTGAMISALTGIGDGPTVTALTNGNYVVFSTAFPGGAVTWGSGTTGVSGTVSAANSLIGVTQGAGQFSNSQYIYIIPLTNGNYLVDSSEWGGGLGAVTWANGARTTSETVSASNSLVGSDGFDQVGSGQYYGRGGVTALTNGNYVVVSPNWDTQGTAGALGAVTWGNGTTGVAGPISPNNSLVGSTPGDQVGQSQGDNFSVTALTNGNYVVDSPDWRVLRGAVTWGNGTAGVDGPVSAANSLVGSNPYDQVGSGQYYSSSGVIALTNGNYVVDSPDWNGDEGAATWGSGTAGISGTVSAANSLVGDTSGDFVGGNYVAGGDTGQGDVYALTNGNYVVASPRWNGAVGAVTWGNGTVGVDGPVSAANSLVGKNPGDTVGGGSQYTSGGEKDAGVVALANGNYVVDSPSWSTNLSAVSGSLGAATWGDGATGTTGTVSAANSLVGSFPGDAVGFDGVTALANGNYVVASPSWNNQGAATWGNGTTGTVGTISAANSLVGSTTGDGTYDSVTALANGNYVVLNPSWNGGAGAATWGKGTTGIDGLVSSSNSLTDFPDLNTSNGVFSVTPLPNGSYFVNNTPGTNITKGALQPEDMWVDGDTGATADGENTPDAQNSLVGNGAPLGIHPIGSGTTFVVSYNIASSSSAGVGFTDPNLLTYAIGQGQTITVTPAFLTHSLDAGTNVTLQANDDITIDSPISETPNGSAGSLTLEAGRSIVLNASINTAGGNLSLIANDAPADGVDESLRDPGNAAITTASGVTLNTGAGTLLTEVINSTDTQPPTVHSVNTPPITAGASNYTFTVTYTDNVAVSAASIGVGNVTVAGPGGALTVTSATTTGSNGTPLTATYTVAAPGGAWVGADNGTYTIALNAGQVMDASGNSVAANLSLATFTVALPSITGVSPGVGVLIGGRSTTITWTNSNFTGNVDILLSTDGGTIFGTTIAANQVNTGSFAWTVLSGVSTTQAEIRVQATAGGNPQATSSGVFTISPVVTTVVPGAGVLLPTPTGTVPVGTTVATFTDPGGPDALSNYSADINWGTGFLTGAGTITYNSQSQVFTVSNNIAAIFPGGGISSVVVRINHDVSTSATVTDTVNAPALPQESLSVVHSNDPSQVPVIAAGAGAGTTYSVMVLSPAATQELNLDLLFTGAYYVSSYGIDGDWLQSGLPSSNPNSNRANGGWYFILPNGTLHQWDGVKSSATAASSPMVATFNATYWQDPNQLLGAPFASAAATQEQILDLVFTGAYYVSSYGIDGDWLQSGLPSSNPNSNRANGGWYFILPNGTLHQWDGVKSSTTETSSPTAATFNAAFWQDPSLLLNPTVPQNPQAGINASFANANSNILQLSGYKTSEAPFSVQVSVSTGGVTTTQDVIVNVTDQAPTLQYPGPQTVAATGTLPVTLMGSDADPNETLTYSAQVFTDQYSALAVASSAFAQVQGLGLSTFTQFAGFQGKWMQSSNGSNAANGGWYFLLSDGTLHAWDGGPASTTASSSPVVGTYSPTLYTNIAQLLSPATTGATANASGNVVTFGGFNAYAGRTLYAAALVFDGILTGYTLFPITVSSSLT